MILPMISMIPYDPKENRYMDSNILYVPWALVNSTAQRSTAPHAGEETTCKLKARTEGDWVSEV